jgi:hypothetical protein
MFLFIVAAFVLLAWRTEVNASKIRDSNRLVCENRNSTTERLNDLYVGLIDIERDNPFSEQGPDQAEIIDRRIVLYRDARADLILLQPICE